MFTTNQIKTLTTENKKNKKKTDKKKLTTEYKPVFFM